MGVIWHGQDSHKQILHKKAYQYIFNYLNITLILVFRLKLPMSQYNSMYEKIIEKNRGI